jgi:hypothetical protein
MDVHTATATALCHHTQRQRLHCWRSRVVLLTYRDHDYDQQTLDT